MDMVTGLFKDVNYVYMVESIVIVAIISLLLFIFFQLGLLKKEKK